MEESKVWIPQNGAVPEDQGSAQDRNRKPWENQAKSTKPKVDEPEVETMVPTGGATSARDFVPGYKLKGLVYGVEDRPPIQIALVCAFQVSYCQGHLFQDHFCVSRSVSCFKVIFTFQGQFRVSRSVLCLKVRFSWRKLCFRQNQWFSCDRSRVEVKGQNLSLDI